MQKFAYIRTAKVLALLFTLFFPGEGEIWESLIFQSFKKLIRYFIPSSNFSHSWAFLTVLTG